MAERSGVQVPGNAGLCTSRSLDHRTPAAGGRCQATPSEPLLRFLRWLRCSVFKIQYLRTPASATTDQIQRLQQPRCLTARTAPIACPEPARPSCPSHTPAGSPRRGCRQSSTPFRPGEREAARPRTAGGAASHSRRRRKRRSPSKCRVRSRPWTRSASSGMWFETITFRQPARLRALQRRDHVVEDHVAARVEDVVAQRVERRRVASRRMADRRKNLAYRRLTASHHAAGVARSDARNRAGATACPPRPGPPSSRS